jgi:hypothetical protein
MIAKLGLYRPVTSFEVDDILWILVDTSDSINMKSPFSLQLQGLLATSFKL